MKRKNQFYVVWSGITPGIYDSWEKCRKQVEGVNGAKYKGFPNYEEALKAQGESPFLYIGKGQISPGKHSFGQLSPYPTGNYLCVDAACSGNPGILEYRGVLMPGCEEVFRRGPFPQGTTNIGEYLAIVTGLAWLKQRNLDIPLYSDSRNGLLWVEKKVINTKLERNSKNEELFVVLSKAHEWLKVNAYRTSLKKWETSAWGEIPADFGRK